MPTRRVEPVELTEIREGDHGQKYRGFDSGKTYWILGIDRNPKAKVGDSGELWYNWNQSRGWYSFKILQTVIEGESDDNKSRREAMDGRFAEGI